MKKLFLISLTMILCSCGPQMKGAFPPGCRPNDLKTEVDSGKMTVNWRSDCKRTISGYNIYISREPLAEKYGHTQLPNNVYPYNENPYPGDTNPDDSSVVYEALGLTDGVKYYVSVRTILPDGMQSRPTNEIVSVCGPSGEVELFQRYKSEHDGFSFSKEQLTRADSDQNDIYYFHADGVDYLNSPKRLNGFLRDIKLSRLPTTGTLEQVKRKGRELSSIPIEDKVSVITGDWVRVLTPEGTGALVQVLGFSGEGDERKIKLFYSYSPLKDEPYL